MPTKVRQSLEKSPHSVVDGWCRANRPLLGTLTPT